MVGPNNCFLTLSVYIYNLCFKYTPKFGYAATVSYAILVLVAILSFIQFKISQQSEKTVSNKVNKSVK